MKLLVVDDSRAMRKLVIRALRATQAFAGATVVEAADGREALTAIAHERPDVVLCDWNMPELSGLELLEHLRLQDDVTPVGLITSESTVGSHDRAISAGAAFVVTKPFTPELLAQALGKVL